MSLLPAVPPRILAYEEGFGERREKSRREIVGRYQSSPQYKAGCVGVRRGGWANLLTLLCVIGGIAIIWMILRTPFAASVAPKSLQHQPEVSEWSIIYREWGYCSTPMEARRRYRNMDKELATRLAGADPDKIARAVRFVYDLSLVFAQDREMDSALGRPYHRDDSGPDWICARYLSGLDEGTLSKTLVLLPDLTRKQITDLLPGINAPEPAPVPSSGDDASSQPLPEQSPEGTDETVHVVESDFGVVWNRIASCQGEGFRTIRGLPFTYVMGGDYVVPDRTAYPLHASNFKKAYEAGPVPGPGSMPKNVMGPSYVWAILHDPRISR